MEEQSQNKTKKKENIQFSTPNAIASDLKIVYSKVKNNLEEVFSIKQGTDINGTIAGINRDMVFKGQAVWILIASIFIASIGLNTNSTAVIIGAMLISPLMGPILGIGLAVGTNDWDLLIKALKNFSIAIVISLLTSTLYFWITPLNDPGAELLSRTKPTILDVLIGIFGGFAGIIAGSRYEKSNVIPGVAIATALMPPLCTAGYGLATAQFSYFFGAFYLFFLNSVFISLSTFIIVRYLRFPIKHLLDKTSEKKFKKYIIIFVVIVILPSAYLFLEVIQQSRFYNYANSFIQDNIKFKGTELINKKLTYNDTLSHIDLYFIGDEIKINTIDSLNKLLPQYGLQSEAKWYKKFLNVTDRTELKIHQAKDNTESLKAQINDMSTNLSKDLRKGIIEDLYKKNEALLQSKDEKINFLEKELVRFKSDSLPLHSLRKELLVQYPEIEKFTLAGTACEMDKDSLMDTIPIILINWSKKINKYSIKKNNKKISIWLKYRLVKDTVRVISY